MSVARAAARALGSASRSVSRSVSPAPGLRLTLDGNIWAIEGGRRTVFMRDSVGLRYLHRLVTEAGRVFHVLDLAQRSDDAGDAGEHLDPAARAAYKARLVELEIQAVAAESAGDRAALARVDREREFLTAEISRAVGLGGRTRKAGCASERARVAVTRRIRDTIQRIVRQAPELGAALARIKTGNYCVFVAEPGNAVEPERHAR